MRRVDRKVMIGLALLWAGTLYGEPFPCPDVGDVAPERELVISLPPVLLSAETRPGGAWHAGTLFEQMFAGPDGARDGFEALAGIFESIGTTQDLIVPAGPTRRVRGRLDVKERIVDPWRASAETPAERLRRAPLRLNAIVYRPDTHEGRFVFAVLDRPSLRPQDDPAAATLPFTLILEYGLPDTPHEWAAAWHELAGLECRPENCADYLAALGRLVDRFAKAGLDPERPGGSRLNQIRTNDILSFPPELREFRLARSGEVARLSPSPVLRTPDFALNGSAELASWMVAQADAIETGTYVLPPEFQTFTAPMYATRPWAFTPPEGVDPRRFERLRGSFAKGTCNGCHGGERATIPVLDGVYHVATDGRLSGYLAGEAIPERAALVCGLVSGSGGPPAIRRNRVH